MAKLWRRKGVLIAGISLLTLSAQAFAQHPSIILRDVNGNPIYDSLKSSDTLTLVKNDNSTETLEAGNPVSFEKSCATGKCHSGIIDEVRAGHPIAIGLHDYPISDDRGAKDFVTNKVLKMRYFRSKSHYGGW